MTWIFKKLKSKSGASMVIALLFFLFCMMVGSVVLAAASANAGKGRRERIAYQNYMAVSSAARLASEDIQRMVFQGTWKNVETVTTTIETTDENGEEKTTTTVTREEQNLETDQEKDGEFATGLYGTGKLLNEQLIDLSDWYYSKIPQLNAIEAPIGTETLECDMTFKAEDFPDVSGRLTVEKSYRLILKLWIEESGGTKENGLTLTFAPDLSPVSVSTKTEKPESEQEDNSATVITTTYHRTKISWKQPVITEGGAP